MISDLAPLWKDWTHQFPHRVVLSLCFLGSGHHNSANLHLNCGLKNAFRVALGVTDSRKRRAFCDRIIWCQLYVPLKANWQNGMQETSLPRVCVWSSQVYECLLSSFFLHSPTTTLIRLVIDLDSTFAQIQTQIQCCGVIQVRKTGASWLNSRQQMMHETLHAFEQWRFVLNALCSSHNGRFFSFWRKLDSDSWRTGGLNEGVGGRNQEPYCFLSAGSDKKTRQTSWGKQDQITWQPFADFRSVKWSVWNHWS